MANRVYETMTRVVLAVFTVRIWRTAPDLNARPEDELELALNDGEFKSRQALAAAIEKFEGISAYEILDEAGCGVVVYPDWS